MIFLDSQKKPEQNLSSALLAVNREEAQDVDYQTALNVWNVALSNGLDD